MLTTQCATPDAGLEAFLQCYVQRISKTGEVIEPVFPPRRHDAYLSICSSLRRDGV